MCGMCAALFWGLAEMMGRKQQEINGTEGSWRGRNDGREERKIWTEERINLKV